MTFDGMEVKVIRSSRKSVAIQISDDLCVVLRVPKRFPESELSGIVERHSEWIRAAYEKQAEKLQAHPEPSAEEAEELYRRAVRVLPKKVEYWSGITGLVPTGIRITSAKKRFGSCSSKKSLCFSYRVMQYDDEFIDYVVLHELVHIKHFNHSKEFYRTIEQYMPDWKRRCNALRE